jgi:hypothetical protein
MSRLRHQGLQQRQFARRELKHIAAVVHGAALPVQPQAADSQRRRRFRFPGRAATVQGAQPSFELIEVERLGQVVVGAAVEPDDPVADRAARSQDQHRRRQAAAAGLFQHLQSIHAGERQVQQHDIRWCCTPARQGLPAIGARCDVESAPAQRALQRRLHGGVVLDEQQFHVARG